MIAHAGLIAKHMLHEVGHEKTFGKPEPYQHVEHWTEQSRERWKRSATAAALSPRDNKTGISGLLRISLVASVKITGVTTCSLTMERPLVSAGRRHAGCSCIAISTPSIRSVSGRLPWAAPPLSIRTCRQTGYTPQKAFFTTHSGAVTNVRQSAFSDRVCAPFRLAKNRCVAALTLTRIANAACPAIQPGCGKKLLHGPCRAV